MAYNPYPNSNPNYSAYFPQSANERSQYTDQSRNNSAYQPNSYQPLSAYQTSQRPQLFAPQSNSSGTASNYQSYGSAAGASDGRSQDARGSYSDGRSSVDTTALGNLAYASSLGRDSASQSQAVSHNDNQNTSGYRNSSGYGVNSAQPIQYQVGHGRADGGSAATSRADYRAQPATASPSFGYSANTANSDFQAQQQRVNSNTPGQAQQSRTPIQQYHANQYNKAPSRPSSGQAVQRSHSKAGSQSLHSPSVLSNQATSNSLHGQPQNSSVAGHPRVPTPQQSIQQPAPYQPPSAHPSDNGQRSHTSSKPSPYNQSVPLKDSGQSTTSKNQSNSHSNQASTPTNQSLTTVDPSQVFNDVEYQRRQAAAAAEAEAARRKTEEARLATQPEENPPSNTPKPATNPADDRNLELEKKNQMELEMKTMIEKMRDYKSKDPSLFSQIWEQVKKGQPTPRAPAQSQSTPQPTATSPVVIDSQSPSPGPQVQLPPESELPAAEPFPPGFDRGRFPAQRRRRGGGTNYTPPKKQATPKGTSKAAPPADQVQKAMQDFHNSITSSKAPITPPVAQMIEQRPAPNQSSTPSTTYARPSQTPKDPPIYPPKPGGTYWPENKKRQLAEAARAALMSAQPNAGKEITAADLHTLLDQNPSYTQMCEILEYKGFTIDRGLFARQLLSAVPDLGSASSKAPPAKPPPHGLPAPIQTPPPFPTSQPPASRPWPHSLRRDMHANGYVTPYTPHNASALPPKDLQYGGPQGHPNLSQQQQQPGALASTSTAQGSNNGPGHGLLHGQAPFSSSVAKATPSFGPTKDGVHWADQQSRSDTAAHRPTKQDMARKRSFGDIVDLTQGLSDEDDEPPRHRQRVEDKNHPPVQVGEASIGKVQGHANDIPPDRAAVEATLGKDGKSLDDFRFNPTLATAGKYLHSPDVIRPMNKRQDALRRSSYNPKTIARDILVAVGKHPIMAPLNAHLDNLREKFIAVNYDSDLSTFRWDLVDPGGPPPPKPTAPNAEIQSTNAKRRPHLAVVVGSGNASVQRHKKGFKPSRGGRFASDGRLRHEIAPQSITQSTTPFDFSRYVHNDLPAMLNPITGNSSQAGYPTGHIMMRSAFLSQSSTPGTKSLPTHIGVNSSSSATPPGPKRVGRPPGARNRKPRPDKGIPKKSQHSSTPAQVQNTPVQNRDNSGPGKEKPSSIKRETPSQSPITSFPNRPRVQTTPIKPSGLRNAMSPTDGIAVVIGSRSPSIVEASRASSELSAKKRRSSNVNIIGDRSSQALSYTVYKCQWDKCPAELHNLETLRKHARKHRNQGGSRNGAIPCLWADCGEVNTGQGYERLSFESEAAWDEHVEGMHINPRAKELGGNPSTVSAGARSPDITGHSPDPHMTPRSGKSGRLNSVTSTPSSARPMAILQS